MGSKEDRATKSYSLRISDNALKNIDEITGYIAYVQYQPLNAIYVGDKIMETIEFIGKNPMVFRECEEIPTKKKIYRKAVCMSWLIIYRVKADTVVIIGVIHGKRKPSKIKPLRKIK